MEFFIGILHLSLAGYVCFSWGYGLYKLIQLILFKISDKYRNRQALMFEDYIYYDIKTSLLLYWGPVMIFKYIKNRV